MAKIKSGKRSSASQIKSFAKRVIAGDNAKNALLSFCQNIRKHQGCGEDICAGSNLSRFYPNIFQEVADLIFLLEDQNSPFVPISKWRIVQDFFQVP